MTGTITRTACPKCKVVGGLRMETKLFSNEIGAFSVAGAQMKVTGEYKPVLLCSNCNLNFPGRFDGEHHAVFDE